MPLKIFDKKLGTKFTHLFSKYFLEDFLEICFHLTIQYGEMYS